MACLARGDQPRLGRCCDCNGILVIERFPIGDKRPNFFAGPYIDRRAEEREQAEWVRTALEDPRTRL